MEKATSMSDWPLTVTGFGFQEIRTFIEFAPLAGARCRFVWVQTVQAFSSSPFSSGGSVMFCCVLPTIPYKMSRRKISCHKKLNKHFETEMTAERWKHRGKKRSLNKPAFQCKFCLNVTAKNPSIGTVHSLSDITPARFRAAQRR